jgi:hypothetical protein
MPWKQRNGDRYYYQSVREGGRVRSQYVGRGEVAELAAQIDAINRLDRAALQARSRDAFRAERDRARQTEALVTTHNRELESAARAHIEAAGYHRHDRGPWRRRRTPMPTQAMPMPTQNETAPVPLPKRESADLARIAEQVWITQAAGEDRALQDRLARHLEELRAELEGPQPSVVERLLAERAALCWFQVQIGEINLAGARSGERPSIAVIHYRERSLDSAHKRYLSALKALAQVRKLALPAIQVNVAETQVNVAGGG